MNEEMFKEMDVDLNNRRKAINRLTIFILITMISLAIITVFLIINSTHWYYSVWAVLSVYYIPRNILLFMSRYEACQAYVPILDFPVILLRIYGKNTITEYFHTGQFGGRFLDSSWSKFQVDIYAKILRPILRCCFWLIPYYIVLFN